MSHSHVSTRNKIINAILFQLCWALAIFSEWHFAVIALCALVLHSAITYLNVKISIQLLTIAVAGIVIDSLFMAVDLYRFEPSDVSVGGGLIPVWLCTLWIGFCLTMKSSLSWLMEKPRWFVVACVIVGPISYASGREFGALQFDDIALVSIAVEWLIIGILSIVVLDTDDSESSVQIPKRYA